MVQSRVLVPQKCPIARQHIANNSCEERASAAGGPAPTVADQLVAGQSQAPAQLCRHRCKNKRTCAHTCCKNGLREDISEVEAVENDVETDSDVEISIYGKPVEEVREFRYLGRCLTSDGDDGKEIKRRIRGARGTMAALLRPLLRRNAASPKTKLAVFVAVTRAQLMFASETWTPTEREWHSLQSMEMQCLRRVVGLRPKMTSDGLRYPRNADVWRAVRKIRPISTIREEVEKRQVMWWGKVLRMGPRSLARSTFLASIPRPSFVGWKRTRCLVPRLRKLLERAGLREEEVWERDQWRDRAATMPPGVVAAGPIDDGPTPSAPK